MLWEYKESLLLKFLKVYFKEEPLENIQMVQKLVIHNLRACLNINDGLDNALSPIILE